VQGNDGIVFHSLLMNTVHNIAMLGKATIRVSSPTMSAAALVVSKDRIGPQPPPGPLLHGYQTDQFMQDEELPTTLPHDVNLSRSDPGSRNGATRRLYQKYSSRKHP